jgi:predicted dehydrogenase
MNEGRRARIGLIGAGSVAARHARVLSGFPDAEVVAVADPAPGRAGALARAVGARAYEDHEALLDRERLDAAYVCVPPFAHGPAEHAVLRRDLPLFVEKPVGLDLAVAEGIAREVERRGVPTATGYHWRGLDTVERAREELACRPARLVAVHWLDAVPPVAWWARRDRSGGQVVEQATHVLDLARVLAGEVASVHAAAARSAPATPEADVDDVTVGVLRFASGALGTLAASCLLPAKRRAGVEVVADGLALWVDEAGLEVVRGGERTALGARVDPRERVDRDFLDAVHGRPGAVRAPYAEALRTHRVAVALARSAAEGREIPVG